VCLDPDDDIVRGLRAAGAARKAAGRACYHTDMYVTERAGLSIGIIGCAVGAPFAVLVAEQLFVLLGRFHRIIQHRKDDRLEQWIEDAKDGLMKSFASGIVRDQATVNVALTEPWSNGRTEG
jgi:hypothetical protein